MNPIAIGLAILFHQKPIPGDYIVEANADLNLRAGDRIHLKPDLCIKRRSISRIKALVRVNPDLEKHHLGDLKNRLNGHVFLIVMDLKIFKSIIRVKPGTHIKAGAKVHAKIEYWPCHRKIERKVDTDGSEV